MSALEHTSEVPLRYLTRADVVTACAQFDPVQVVHEALELHGLRRTTLPAEAYLGWETSEGERARSLALPGALWGTDPVVGLKIINGSLGNTRRGIARAQGLTFLFDLDTAWPLVMMEAAYLSALRTAAYTALSIDHLASSASRIAIIGCGALGEAHVQLLSQRLPGSRFLIHDIDGHRRDQMASRLAESGVQADGVSSARAAVEGADVVVTVTTADASYLEFGWLRPGTLIAHVSLDDVTPEVVERADLVVVDDWELVRNDNQRLLGRMYRAARVTGPADVNQSPRGRRVDATMAQILTAEHPGRTSVEQIILSNPFGMGILDVAFAHQVWQVAQATGLGMKLPI
ncbi:ornithine cyclodeaminase family protein [Streptomyces sp. PTM05]|uniref:Ornithine cyclodeaminase family protein n=1 Tax=Streptantibioticus parmotrematis TaxID=2873249 RepID=A0ABS7QUZ9_9ACTN|nr:ornithine cyclodeaminase family protein [Streptantibioticus parmotrematis]MBY8887019.1 ornithine cyclodeaminase family protein [Streptantibioticus parmotrematis]